MPIANKTTLLFLVLLFFRSAAFAQCTANAGPDTSVCLGATVQIGSLPAAATGSGVIQYDWSANPNALSCTNCDHPLANPATDQIYMLTITDDTGCVATDAVSVTVLPPPVAGFTITNNNVCANVPVQFTNTSSGTGLTYLWNFGDPASGAANTSTLQNPTHFFNAIGTGSQTFTVTLVVTAANGCTHSFNQTVTVLSLPEPGLIDPVADMRNCDGNTFPMTVYDITVSNANSNYTIQWGDGTPDFNAGSFPGSVSHTYTTQEIFDLLYIVTGTNGCVDTASYIVSNITNPAIGAANPGATTGCGPLMLCFPLNNFSSNHSSTYYVVDYGDGSPFDTLPHPPPASVCHTYTESSCGQPGNAFTFSITAINRCDISETSIFPIRIYLPATPNFDVQENACVGTPVTFQNLTTTGFNSACSAATVFNWNFGDGQTLTTVTPTNPSHTYTSPGTYTVTLTTTNSCGSTVITQPICIESPPVPNFTLAPNAGCAPFTTQITDLSTLADICEVTRNWTVIFNGSTCLPSTGQFQFVNGTNATSVNPEIQFLQPGNYTVRLTLTNSCGSFQYTQPVTVQAPPQLALNPLAVICAGTAVNPTAAANNCYESIDTYAWSFPGGSPASAATLVPGAITYAANGSYTISLTATNACGSQTASTSLIVNPIPPALNPAVNSPVCAGQAANFTSDLVPGVTYSWTGPGFSSTAQNFTLPAVTPANAGTYTLTGSLGACPGPPASVNLVVQPLPTVTVTPPAATLCAGTPVVLTASGATEYTWAADPALNTTTGDVVTATPLSTTTYAVTGTTGTCNGTASVTITVNPLPVVDAGNDTTFCDQPVPMQLTATPSGGTWTGTNVSPAGVFTPNGTGSFTLTYAFTDGNNCTNTDTRTITVIAPTFAMAGPDTTVCVDAANTLLTGLPAGGTWSGSGVTITGVFDPTIAGTFPLVYSLGTGTCLTQDTLQAIVNPLPIVDAGTDLEACIDAVPSVLSGTPAGGNWSGTGVTDPAGNFDPSLAGAGTHTLTYAYTDPVTGCSNTDGLTATIHPLPLVDAGTDTTLCNQPVPVQLNAVPGGGTWSGTDITPSGIFTPSTTGAFTVTYTFTDANGCSNADTRTVTVLNPTNANAGNDTSLCADAPNLVLAPTPVGGTWSGTGVTPGGTFDPATAGTFELVYTFGTGTCLTRDTLEVFVNALPIADAGSDSALCIDAVPIILNGTPAGGTWSGNGVTDPAAGTFDPAVAAAGTHSETYTYVDPLTGCAGVDQLAVTVHPLPVVDAGADTTVCDQPSPIQFFATPAGGTWSGTGITTGGVFTPNGTGTFTLTYTFTNANGCTNADSRDVIVNAPIQAAAGNDLALCIDAANVTLNGTPAAGTWTGSGVTAAGVFDPTVAGSFPLIYTTGSGNCLTRDTLLAVVNPLPTVDAGTGFTECLDAAPSVLTGTPAGGSWTGTGITDPIGNFDPGAAGIGTHVLTYSYTDANGCTNTDVLSAIINALPLVNAGNDTTLCNQPFPVQFTGTPAGGTWSGPDVTAGGVYTPNGAGTFTLTYSFTNGNGCTNTDTRLVTVVNPTQASAGNDLAVCVDAASIVLNGTPASGTWTGTGVTSGGIFDPTTAGTFQLVYTTGVGNCLTRDTMLLVVNPLPVVNAGSDLTRCIDAPASILNGTPAGGTWAGAGITDPAGNFDPATAGAGTHTLTYDYTDANGCSGQDQLNATINPLPVVDAGADTTICDQPIPVQFNATPAGGTWSGPNITAAGLFTPAGAGNFTITYTFTNGANCSGTDSRIVTVDPPVAANAGTDLAACIDAPNTVLNGAPASGTWTGLNVTPGGLFDPTTAGDFELVLSNGSGNCLTRDTMVFTVHPLPIVSAGPDAAFCPSDAPVDFTGLPSGGTWNGNGITDAAAGTFDPGIPAAGSHPEIYTYTEPTTGCVNRDTLTAIVHPTPVPAFTFNAVTCTGTAETFTNNSTLAATCDWDFGDGNGSTAQTPAHTYMSAGFYDIELIVTSAFGCMDSLTQQIEVREPPVADFSVLPDSACGPVNVAFTNSSTGSALSFAWDFGNGQSSALAAPGNQVYAAGNIADTNYTVTLSVTNFCGTDTETATITAMPSPTAIFGTNTDIGCSPLVLDITNNSIGLPDVYSWDFGDGTTGSDSIGVFQHTFYTGAEDTTYTIMLAVANECGMDTVYHTITVLPVAVNAFFNVDDPDGCVPHTVNLTQFTTGATFYSWDLGDGNISADQHPTHTYTEPGTYTVSLFANDGCGYDTTTAIITVFPSPNVAFSSEPDSVCIDQPFTFTNLSTGLAGTEWDFGDGETSSLFDPAHTYTTSGTYTVTLTGISQSNGCAASVSHPVVVSTNPVAAFTANPNAGCVSLAVTFTNNSTNTDFQSWSFGDGNTSTQLNPSHTYTAPGNYVVKLYVENANGCADSLELPITVYPLPVASFSTNATASNFCELPASAAFTNTSTGAVNYEWDFGNGNTSALTDPSTVYPNAGSYNVQLIATSLYGCADTTVQTVNVYEPPTAAFQLPEPTVCANEPIVFTSSSLLADSVLWDFGNGTSVTGTPVTFAFDGAGSFPVTLIAYGDGGCSDTLTLATPIVVNPAPEAGFEYENVQNGDDPLSGIVEFTNTTVNGDNYWWEFGNGDTSSLENPVIQFSESGEFDVTLTATNQFGCVDVITQTIFVDFFYGLFIPNAINPGHTDFEVSHFIPKGVGLKTFELLIYDDWGNLIWQTTALDAQGRPTESWDGTFNGQPVQQDAYVWKATATFLNDQIWEGKEYPNRKIKRAGTVTVIR